MIKKIISFYGLIQLKTIICTLILCNTDYSNYKVNDNAMDHKTQK